MAHVYIIKLNKNISFIAIFLKGKKKRMGIKSKLLKLNLNGWLRNFYFLYMHWRTTEDSSRRKEHSGGIVLDDLKGKNIEDRKTI